ncbi:hypothetical protein [Actinomadura sp. 6K520]|uniref:hypothetical protein n=1 Tax=Actinomadura sp. 6K520 TaxID=2530364 RepID=UPI001044A507|nr:hypothetical protein [Actinomadura sp. 6K520]TDE32817.1 hypothetical protein E1289_14285 [Actinomadura sp. 6K520]
MTTSTVVTITSTIARPIPTTKKIPRLSVSQKHRLWDKDGSSADEQRRSDTYRPTSMAADRAVEMMRELLPKGPNQLEARDPSRDEEQSLLTLLNDNSAARGSRSICPGSAPRC